RYLFLMIAVCGIFVLSFFGMRSLFLNWQQSPATQVFLPPLNPNGLSYLYQFSFTHIFGSFLLSLLLGSMLFIALLVLNRFIDRSFFYPEEPYLISIAVFLVGFPGFLYYLAVTLLFYLLVLILLLPTKFREEKISAYYLWLPLALIMLFVLRYLPHMLPYLTDL